MVGAVNLATALSSRMPTVDRVLPWLADIDLNAVGYLIGGLLAQPSGLMVPVRATGVPSGNVMRE